MTPPIPVFRRPPLKHRSEITSHYLPPTECEEDEQPMDDGRGQGGTPRRKSVRRSTSLTTVIKRVSFSPNQSESFAFIDNHRSLTQPRPLDNRQAVAISSQMNPAWTAPARSPPIKSGLPLTGRPTLPISSSSVPDMILDGRGRVAIRGGRGGGRGDEEARGGGSSPQLFQEPLQQQQTHDPYHRPPASHAPSDDSYLFDRSTNSSQPSER